MKIDIKDLKIWIYENTHTIEHGSGYPKIIHQGDILKYIQKLDKKRNGVLTSRL